MQFRTEVHFPEQTIKIQPQSAVFSIGSCFADMLANTFKDAQIQTLSNPFGTIFNPHSIANAIERIHKNQPYTEEDLVEYKGCILSLHHHTRFDSPKAETTLQKINEELHNAHAFLRKANFVFITLGTSFAYEFLPQNILVANCHKIPNKFFRRVLLSQEKILQDVQKTISLLRNICPTNAQLFFTVSPVRHTKEGMMENQRSKAKLLCAIHDAIENETHCHYLPIYEIMMDDLRDYRFYKEDMIHPTEQAFRYIFDKFQKTHCTEECMAFIKENLKIMQSLLHKPADPQSAQYIDLKNELKNKISAQQAKVSHLIFSQALDTLSP